LKQDCKMGDLKPYAVFAETVAAGSMSAAARRLGMSPSAVSQTLRALEREAGVTLLHRSTRKLTLTEAGERCYPYCRQMLEAARAAAESLALARDAPTGELRVAAPVGFATHIGPALAPLLARSPQLRLRLLVDDAMIDLIDARIDIAVRVGRIADSSWTARRLCELEMILCSAPSYLERHAAPAEPRELASHQWLGSAHEAVDPPQAGTLAAAERPPGMTLDLHGPAGQRERVGVAVRIASNNLLALRQMCEQGLGVARLVHADVLPLLANGSLVRLLPQWRFAPMPVTAITPQRDGEPAKVRLAMAALQAYFARLPGLAAGPVSASAAP
jgi:DNA-binding transcriptional LysR family regulator